MEINGCKVLIVDDEVSFLLILQQFIGNLNATVIIASNGEKALEMIRDEKPDIAIIDVYLPEMNGIQLIAKARRIAPELPFILLTASVTEEMLEEALHLGVRDFFRKPIDHTRLPLSLSRIWEETLIMRELKRLQTADAAFTRMPKSIINALPRNCLIAFDDHSEPVFRNDSFFQYFALHYSIDEESLLESLMKPLRRDNLQKKVLEGNDILAKEIAVDIGSLTLHLAYTLKLLRFEGKKAVALIIQDNTERHLMESLEKRNQELNLLYDEKKKFYRMIVHDLKNPLSNMKVNLSLLHGMGELNENQRECYETLDKDVTKMTEMVTSLLDIAKLEDMEEFNCGEKVDIAELTRNKTAQFTNAAESKGLRIVTDISDEPLWIIAEPLTVASVVDNLISNALKYSDRGEIRITVRESPPFALLSVRDNGCGISEDEKENIFRQYHRTLRREDTEGHGLGLYLTRRIVEKYDGKIECDSKVGEGSEFRVYLPLTGN